MSETALGRRHRLMRALTPTLGPDYRPGRKTARRVSRRAPGEMPPWRVTVLLPAKWLVAPGETHVPGVTIEPEDISGEMAVIEHRDLEWACRQLCTFLLAVANDERIITANVTHDGVTRSQQIAVSPEAVEFPRGAQTTWRVTG